MSSVVFETPAGAAASNVTLSSNRSSACFTGSKPYGVRSTVAVGQGPDSFYYFEASRSSLVNMNIGVGGAALLDSGSGPDLGPTADSLVASHTNTLTQDGAGGTQYGQVGEQTVMGYAVDYRGTHPVVYVIGNANAPGATCPSGQTGNVPCVLNRVQLARTTGALHIYAYGTGDGSSTGPMVSINTGSDLAAKPYAYPQAGVRQALRASFYQGDRGFNPQWPSGVGPVALPALSRTGRERAVVRLGDGTPHTSALSATAGGSTAAIQWTDETGTLRGTGGTLSLTPTLLAALGAGEHALRAGVTDTSTGLYTELSHTLKIDASGTNLDDDGDGLNYDQEKTAGTDPANADSDADGLSDGAEAALGFNPALTDTDGNGINDGRQLAGNAALNQRLSLVMETGAYATSRGIVLSDDGLSAAFTSDVNPDCVQRRGVYADADFADIQHCYKRAVRANGGVQPGEFRYFETRRLAGQDNLGQGFITANSTIDPYCCFNNTAAPSAPAARTPPSMSVNSAGGMYVQLVTTNGYNTSATTHYGFAVDYTGANPVVYVVTNDGVGGMAINPLSTPGFNGQAAIPFFYGNPLSDTEARGAMNLGLQSFHYDTAALRTALGSLGANVSQFQPGVGVHRRP